MAADAQEPDPDEGIVECQTRAFIVDLDLMRARRFIPVDGVPATLPWVEGPQPALPVEWPPFLWETRYCPVDDRLVAICGWLAHEIEALKHLQQLYRHQGPLGRMPRNEGDVVRDAYRLVRHLRGQQRTVVHDDDPTVNRPDWNAHEAEVVLGRLREQLAAELAAEAPAPARCKKKVRDRKMDARDKWIYQQCFKGRRYNQIVADLEKKAREKNWQPITSPTGIRSTAIKYSKRNGLDPIPSRQNL